MPEPPNKEHLAHRLHERIARLSSESNISFDALMRRGKTSLLLESTADLDTALRHRRAAVELAAAIDELRGLEGK